MAFKAVIFDVDGTLVNSLVSYQQAFNGGTAQFGLPAVEVEPLAAYLTLGTGLEEIIRRMHPGFDEALIPACREQIFASFLTLTGDVAPLLPDAIHVLGELKARGIKMGIATGRGSESSRLRESFRKLGIDDFFDAVVTAGEVERKPAPDSIIECARRLGVDARDCLVVGDAVADIQAAKAAGATPIAVTTGVSDENKLASHGPAKLYHKLSDILELFE